MTGHPIPLRVQIEGRAMVVQCTLLAPNTNREDAHAEQWTIQNAALELSVSSDSMEMAIEEARVCVFSWITNSLRWLAKLGGAL